ncbi:ParB/RepB/Spo0J family partition protein [Candidatus Chordibacter forsetii]|uniref:ParB/RepB/Spo0J family partition protein n=1 Tax=Candidatus Chordibacter forsetii TaxID=3381758 RepID=UPI0038998DC1
MNTPTRRLGRGLGSLIAGGGVGAAISQEPVLPVSKPVPEKVLVTEEVTITPPEPKVEQVSNQLQELAIDQVVPNPHQPRKVIDPEAIRDLAASIESEGLLQPIVVRPTNKGYELIAGERRWRAHQYLEKPTILARLLDASDLSSASLSLIENLQREELNPVEEALGYQSLVSDFNLTQAEVAERMGKSRTHITNLMRLLQLDGELKRLLAEGELSVGHAKVLLSIEDPKHRLSIGQQAVLEGWTVRQTEDALSRGLVQTGAPLQRKNSSSVHYEELSKVTARTTGRKVKIKSTATGKGVISFSFKDESDLRTLLTKFEV